MTTVIVVDGKEEVKSLPFLSPVTHAEKISMQGLEAVFKQCQDFLRNSKCDQEQLDGFFLCLEQFCADFAMSPKQILELLYKRGELGRQGNRTLRAALVAWALQQGCCDVGLFARIVDSAHVLKLVVKCLDGYKLEEIDFFRACKRNGMRHSR